MERYSFSKVMLEIKSWGRWRSCCRVSESIVGSLLVVLGPAMHLGSSSPTQCSRSDTSGERSLFEIKISPACILYPHSSSGRRGTGSCTCVTLLYLLSFSGFSVERLKRWSMCSFKAPFPTRGSPKVVTCGFQPRASNSRDAMAATAPPRECPTRVSL